MLGMEKTVLNDNDRKVELVVLGLGLILVGLTIIFEKKVTGEYPWEHDRTPIVETLGDR